MEDETPRRVSSLHFAEDWRTHELIPYPAAKRAHMQLLPLPWFAEWPRPAQHSAHGGQARLKGRKEHGRNEAREPAPKQLAFASAW